MTVRSSASNNSTTRECDILSAVAINVPTKDAPERNRRMAGIMTIGEILVEIMATERGQSFRTPGTLVGPFPSGAPAIFIDQVGQTGLTAFGPEGQSRAVLP